MGIDFGGLVTAGALGGIGQGITRGLEIEQQMRQMRNEAAYRNAMLGNAQDRTQLRAQGLYDQLTKTAMANMQQGVPGFEDPIKASAWVAAQAGRIPGLNSSDALNWAAMNGLGTGTGQGTPPPVQTAPPAPSTPPVVQQQTPPAPNFAGNYSPTLQLGVNRPTPPVLPPQRLNFAVPPAPAPIAAPSSPVDLANAPSTTPAPAATTPAPAAPTPRPVSVGSITVAGQPIAPVNDKIASYADELAADLASKRQALTQAQQDLAAYDQANPYATASKKRTGLLALIEKLGPDITTAEDKYGSFLTQNYGPDAAKAAVDAQNAFNKPYQDVLNDAQAGNISPFDVNNRVAALYPNGNAPSVPQRQLNFGQTDPNKIAAAAAPILGAWQQWQKNGGPEPFVSVGGEMRPVSDVIDDTGHFRTVADVAVGPTAGAANNEKNAAAKKAIADAQSAALDAQEKILLLPEAQRPAEVMKFNASPAGQLAPIPLQVVSPGTPARQGAPITVPNPLFGTQLLTQPITPGGPLPSRTMQIPGQMIPATPPTYAMPQPNLIDQGKIAQSQASAKRDLAAAGHDQVLAQNDKLHQPYIAGTDAANMAIKQGEATKIGNENANYSNPLIGKYQSDKDAAAKVMQGLTTPKYDSMTGKPIPGSAPVTFGPIGQPVFNTPAAQQEWLNAQQKYKAANDNLWRAQNAPQPSVGSYSGGKGVQATMQQYAPVIQQYKGNLPIPLIAAVMQQESGGHQYTRDGRVLVSTLSDGSPGAHGIMQIMPGTAHGLNIDDPAQNIQAGLNELNMLWNRYHGNIPLVLAAYNAGIGAVEGGYTDRHGKYHAPHAPAIPPFGETQQYVKNITSMIGGSGSSTTQTAPPPPPVTTFKVGQATTGKLNGNPYSLKRIK